MKSCFSRRRSLFFATIGLAVFVLTAPSVVAAAVVVAGVATVVLAVCVVSLANLVLRLVPAAVDVVFRCRDRSRRLRAGAALRARLPSRRTRKIISLPRL